MRQIITWAGALLLGCMLSFGGLLFTKLGNTILLPFIQSALNYSLPFQTQIQAISITLDSIHAELTLNKTLAIVLDGGHSLGSKINIRARIYPLNTNDSYDKDSKPIGHLTMQGSATNYTIHSTPHENATSSNFKLFAHMKFLSIQQYALDLHSIPMEPIARFLDLAINPQGTLSLVMQGESHTMQLYLQSDGFSLGDLRINIDSLYYKRDTTHQELAGTLNIAGKTIAMLGNAKAKAPLQTTLYSSHQAIMASTQTQLIDNALIYTLHISDLAAFGDILGITMSGKLELQGTISANNGLHINATSQSLGGDSVLSLEKNTMTFVGKNLSLRRITQLLNAPTILDSRLMIDSVYNLTFHKGTINILGQNFTILLDNLKEFSLEAFDMHNGAQDSWGVGFDNIGADSSLSLNGQIEQTQITAQATIKSQDQSIHTSKCIIDLATQSIDIEFLESTIKLQGKISEMQAPSK